MEIIKLSKIMALRLSSINAGIAILTFFALELFNRAWITIFQWHILIGFDMSEGEIFFTTLKIFGITSGLSMIFVGLSSRSWITVTTEN